MAERDLLADLNEAQREAVLHREGPLLILAGAGSGKTRVITRRVAYLLEQGIPPGQILAITFTNKAAGEMRQRIDALSPGNKVWISTFHSLGVRLLRQYHDRFDVDRNFTIYDQNDRVTIVKQALEDAGIESGRATPESVMSAISKAKNELRSPERYGREAKDFFEHLVTKVYTAYERRLRNANALDFDDLLYWPALTLKNKPDFRAELDARFRFVLVDEYQDTNAAQYDIARYLTIDHPNLCVVGDPDQSIYRFRGSDIRNILNFERDFPSARVLTLSLNYRSTASILAAADALIAHNRQRKPKTLSTLNPQGQKVQALTYPSSVEEAQGVARRIREAVQAGKRRYRDFAILVRMNALTRGVETAFVQHQVPFQIVKGLAFFDRKENRDVIAYLRLLVNPRDDVSFQRVVNEPARGIGKTTLDHLARYAAGQEIGLLEACGRAEFIPGLKARAATALRDFHALLGRLGAFREVPPHDVIREVLDLSGYRKMLKESKDEEDQQRLANIEELITAAAQFAKENSTATIADFLESITLSSDLDSWDSEQDVVSVMTMHAAKGLEFPVVFVMAVEQGILPHDRSLSRPDKPEELEEERRLAYVGMTRAMEELYLTRAVQREFRGQMLNPIPSMFLDELPPHVVDFFDAAGNGTMSIADRWRGGGGPAAEEGWNDTGMRPIPMPPPPKRRRLDRFSQGMTVRHARHGVGQVVAVSVLGGRQTVKVRFQTAGVLTLIISEETLEILSSA
jgi:DNA helicase-2/ATP-dependent DNA helicase PcrA